MEITVRHAPSFSVGRCAMAGGEILRVESGAMMATSDGVGIESGMQGGLMKSLRRGVLGGESFFITTYTAPAGGGWVDVAAHLPGDMTTVEVHDQPVFIQRGSYIASEEGVEHRHQVGRLQVAVRRRGRLPAARDGPGHGGARLLRRARPRPAGGGGADDGRLRPHGRVRRGRARSACGAPPRGAPSRA